MDGSLTATFEQDSYVYLKTGDNTRWYMTNGWLGTAVTSATLYNTDTLGENGDKLFVPGGVEVVFTLTEGADDTFTLSYELNGEPPEPDHNFYLNGWINNADYSGDDYVFTEGGVFGISWVI